MTARYRVVHFVPDPFTGARIPLAAIVAGGGGVSIASAGHVPGAVCLGRPSTYAAMQMVLESLSAVESLDVLPVAIGPHAVLDVERQIPGDVADPVRWVVENVLPRTDEAQPARAAKSHHRDTQGFRLFETWKVSQYVHQRFQPDEHWAGMRVGVPRKLGSISHWVGASKVGILLMEPLIPTRSGFQRELVEVYQRFAGYRAFLDRGGAPEEAKQHTKLCVYVLPGGKSGDRSSALGAFADVEAVTIDTESDSAQRSFVEEIRALGRAAEPQTDLSDPQTN